jgi:uncharacterized protein (TIGR02145 family)
MKTKTLLTVIAFIFALSTFSQNPALELTFTAIDNAAYVQLDSIKVMNRTEGGDTVLYWPDTVLVFGDPVGILETFSEKNGFNVFQNYPNPVTDQTTISLYVPFKDKVGIIITDMMGRVVLKSDRVLGKGIHSFKYTPGGGNLYFFSAQWRGAKSSIKILQTSSNSIRASSLEYIGSEASSAHLKFTTDVQSFSFSIGDTLLYIGYSNTLQSGMPDAPETSENYNFQFATNIPCPGTPTVTYEGQTYNTIQVYSQCWLKENLNVGTMIPGGSEMQNNGYMEKYCYNNDPANCTVFGGLYQWNEMMQYTTTQGVQGICPPDWHLPTDEEWKVLEGAVDSQYGIGDPEWDFSWQYLGYDAGTNLKTKSGWDNNGNGTDLFGFSGMPGGDRYDNGVFYHIAQYGNWWSSTERSYNSIWVYDLSYYYPRVGRYYYWGELGYSVRCIKD